MKESQIFLTLNRDRHLEVYRKKMNLYISMYFTVYAFTIHGCLAPLPTRDERGSVSTVQSVLDRMSRNLQGIRRTIEMNPSLQTLRRVLRELRHLLRNEHPRSQDYIGTLDDLKMRLEKPILFVRADKSSLSERNSHYLRAQIIWVSLR